MTTDSALSTSSSSLTQPPADRHPRQHPSWSTLRWLFLMRLVIVIGLILAFSPNAIDPLIRNTDTGLAWQILLVYALIVIVSGLGLYSRWPSRQNQVYLAIFIDIFVFTLLMHAAGGVSSGMGMLIAVAVAAGALTMEGRLSLLFASLASLAVITQQTYTAMQGNIPAFTQAGLLGILFFAVAVVAQMLYRRVRAAEALAARRKVDIDDLSQLNEFIIRNMSMGVLVVDGERQVRQMNQAAHELLDTRGRMRNACQLSEISPELAEWIRKHMTAGRDVDGVISRGEQEIKISMKLIGTYRSNGLIIYLRDNREALAEAQQIKLASLGTLTASIAHNIRNPLSSINHAAQLFDEDEGISDDNRHLLDIIRRNCMRIDEIVSSILQLSRRNRMEPRQLDLEEWLESFCIEFRETHQLESARLRLRTNAEPHVCEVDPRHLHQIIANLCENALVHAGTPTHPAHIVITLTTSRSSGHSQIRVCDDGPGVPPEKVDEIFTPFFTTRSTGTGLGLYIGRELAESNGIRLTYRRGKTHGSCFCLHFPP